MQGSSDAGSVGFRCPRLHPAVQFGQKAAAQTRGCGGGRQSGEANLLVFSPKAEPVPCEGAAWGDPPRPFW